MSSTDPQAPAAPTAPNAAGKDTARGAGQLLVELGPVAVFMLSYNIIRGLPADHALFAAVGGSPGEAIFFATGLFMAATLSALAYTWFTKRTLPPALLVMAGLVAAFGTLTFLFRDPTFIKVKPTIVNLFYSGAIFISLAIGQNVWKLLFKHVFELPDRVWAILAMRWAVFFLVMAGLNEIVWRNFDEAFWVNFRFWGVFPLVIGFALANLPITLKWVGRDNADFAAGRPNAAGAASET